MGYIIDFGHGDTPPRPLNYILRLRGDSTNGMYDLAGNINDLNMRNSYASNDGFINFNKSYITYNFDKQIDEGEDFTICTWYQDPNLPTNNNISTSENGATKDITHVFFGNHLNIDTNPSLRYGDFNFIWLDNDPNNAHRQTEIILITPVNKSNGWDSWWSSLQYHNIWNTNLNHWAVARKNNVMYGFYNGVLINTCNCDYQIFRSGTKTSILGTINDQNGRGYQITRPCFNGKIKDFCIIKGRALWTKNFTPPSDYLPDEW